ncbi:MAG TPA: type II CAAX endopeptidase family protein [Nocardioidaceae bacterium]|nr:type II CAAX endopeptidase family protein [Nocardioidaceae bacterium]
MNIPRYRLTIFVLLAYVLSWWVFPLHVSGFPVFPFGPDLAAVLVVGLTVGRPGIAALMRRLRTWRARPQWFALAVGLPAGIALLSVAALRLTRDPVTGMPGPASLLEFVVVLPVMVVVGGALGEELGWRGFALPTLQRRHNPLIAVGILTGIHLGWHLPLFLVNDPPLLAPFAIELAGGGLVLAWIANRNDSLWPVILTHGAHNMAQQAFMGGLSGADLVAVQWLTALGWLVAGAVVVAGTRGRLGMTALPEPTHVPTAYYSANS